LDCTDTALLEFIVLTYWTVSAACLYILL